MKKNLTSKSGIFSPRVLLAFTLCSVGAFLVVLSLKANPPSAPGWSIVTLTNTSTNDFLSSITCVSASECWAVGGSDDQTLIEQWDGTSWASATSPNGFLSGITCVSASECWAVGWTHAPYETPLVEQWDGTSWSIVTSPNNSTEGSELSDVTCASASDCWAVGRFYNGIYLQTLIERWDGTSWSIVTSPNGNATSTNERGVTCISASECWAVGQYNNGSNTSGYYQTLIEQWDGTSWSIVTSPNQLDYQNNIASNELSKVTCTSASDCWAVGSSDTYPSGGFLLGQTLIEQWDGTSWSIVASPNNNNGELGNGLSGVTCASASDCWAVGGSGDQTLIEQWDGTSWSIVTSPNYIMSNELSGVTCTSESECWAVGLYTYNGGGMFPNNQPLIEEYTPPHAIPGNLLASVNGTAQNGGGSVVQYAPGGTQSTFVSNLDRPRGMAFDSAGNFFVATTTLDNSGNYQGTIFKITPGGMISTFATAFPSNLFLQGLVTDSAGNVFVGAGDQSSPPNVAGTIFKVTPGSTVSTFGTFGSPGDTPRGLAFDNAGNLYASDESDQTIFKFTAPFTAPNVPSIFAGPTAFISPQNPGGLAFDSSGNLYASTSDGNTPSTGEILEFAPNGMENSPPFATGLTNQPRGLAFDGAGNLFLAEIPGNTTGDVLEFTPGGTGTVPGIVPASGGVAYFASGIGGPQGNGGPEFLVFPPGETPVGSNETVNTGTAGSALIALTFPQVTAGGTTTVTPIDPSSAGTLPSGYELTGSNLAFEITTTATYTTPIIIAFQVPSVDPATFSQLRVLHNEGGILVDVTASNPPPNPTTQTIYASVSSLSPFVIAKLACTPPIIKSVTANPSSIWPPNNEFIPVTVTVKASATCGVASTKIISVSSNESGSGQYKITGNLTVNLLAARNGNGNGRIYTITVQCKDPSNNASTKTVTVMVPHDQGN